MFIWEYAYYIFLHTASVHFTWHRGPECSKIGQVKKQDQGDERSSIPESQRSFSSLTKDKPVRAYAEETGR